MNIPVMSPGGIRTPDSSVPLPAMARRTSSKPLSTHAIRIISVFFWTLFGAFRRDYYALANYDGTALYEYPHAAVGQSEWGSCNFMHSRGEVRSFLPSRPPATGSPNSTWTVFGMMPSAARSTGRDRGAGCQLQCGGISEKHEPGSEKAPSFRHPRSRRLHQFPRSH